MATLPGIGAVFLRVYENTLVRQTEAELVALGAALSAAASASWPAVPPGRPISPVPASPVDPYGARAVTEVDLSATPILPERPSPTPAAPPLADAVAAGTRLQPILAGTRAATLASIVLLDRDGRIVSDTGARGSYADLPEVAAALHGEPHTVLRRNGAYRAIYRFE